MKNRCSETGFSLIEIAIVLTIVALLLAGLIPTLSSQVDQQHRNETRKQMDEIRNALVGYAASQTPPKLPCPAKPDIPSGSLNAGVSDCSLLASGVGVLPWVTLGVSETDAWGRRFTYAVPSTYAGPAGFTLTSTSSINVLSAAAGVTVGSAVPAVIISHGSNGLGAYTTQGIQITTAGAGADETANTDGAAPFVSHESSSDFDDQVVWLSPNTLFNRMVTAGKLP